MEYPHFRSADELRLGVRLWQTVSPVLILFGTFGNILSIKILSAGRFNKWASTVYLLALACADISMLYVGLLRQWFKYTFGRDIRHMSSVTCKVHWWLMYSTADCNVWILSAITVERLLSTILPFRSKQVCTMGVAKVVLLAIVISALLINSHLLYGFGRLEIQDGNTTMVIPCAPLTKAYDDFFGKVWTWIDLCKYSLIPFVIMSTGNVYITYKVIFSARKAKHQVAPVNVQESKKVSNMSTLLVALNCAFILCTLPVCIYFIGEPYWIPKDVPRNIQLQDPWWAFVNLLMYTNNSINFILYCLSGSRFREAIRKMFQCRKGQVLPGAGSGTDNAGTGLTGKNISARI